MVGRYSYAGYVPLLSAVLYLAQLEPHAFARYNPTGRSWIELFSEIVCAHSDGLPDLQNSTIRAAYCRGDTIRAWGSNRIVSPGQWEAAWYPATLAVGFQPNRVPTVVGSGFKIPQL
jgi:hypothetical protein